MFLHPLMSFRGSSEHFSEQANKMEACLSIWLHNKFHFGARLSNTRQQCSL